MCFGAQAHVSVQADKGGNPEIVRESQKKRGASVELVDEVIALFDQHRGGQWSSETLSSLPVGDRVW